MTAPTRHDPEPPSGSSVGRWRRIGRTYRPDWFALLWLPYAYLVVRFWFVTDDAFISFRYSLNLALGRGLRWNIGEQPPVEGYSNFLWVLIGSLFERLGLDITFWTPLMSFACGTVLLFLVFDALRRRLKLSPSIVSLGTLSLGAFPPYALWSSSGLETLPFALVMFLTFERLVLRPAGVAALGAAISALLVVLIRAEGFAWVPVLLTLGLASRWLAGQRSWRPWLVFASLVVLGSAVYCGWRLTYHHDWLPNTVYAKSGLPASYYQRGFDYVAVQFLTFIPLFVIIPGGLAALRRGRRAIGAPVAALGWAFPLYAIAARGDFMTMGRFLVPGLAFNALLFAWLLEDIAARTALRRTVAGLVGVGCIAAGLLPGWNIHLTPRALRAKFHFRYNEARYRSEHDQWLFQRANARQWTTRGRALKAFAAARRLGPEASVVLGAIGATGYYSELTLYDTNGLVNREVARRPFAPGSELKSPGHDKTVPATFFLKYKPTFLFADVFVSDRPSAAAKRLLPHAQELYNRWPEHAVAQSYVPDFVRLLERDPDGQTQYLVLWRRLPAGADWQVAWREFEERRQRLAADGAAPVLSLSEARISDG